MTTDWMRLGNEGSVPSPGLLIYPSRVEANLDRMIAMVGDPARLRPHVKTHKTPQIVALQVARGITRCKCATIAEAEMAATAGATDILLASQPVGPNQGRLLALIGAFPQVRFSTLVDDGAVARALDAVGRSHGVSIEVFLDLDVGQHRTGVAPGPAALELGLTIAGLPGLTLAGLHAYDGHLRHGDVSERTRAVDAIFERVMELRNELGKKGVAVPALIAGGTPTFPIHARHAGVECSPGTCLLWDAGYAASFADLDFLNAAVLLTRVISRPAGNRLCLDLGHKSVASEMPHPRVIFPDLPDAVPVLHSEEHLVVETSRAARLPVGSVLYGIPWHICPTVALHASFNVVEDGWVTGQWPVTARQRSLNY